ncbi:strawberry notch-like NTP hydrolase domain-containing protein, partial [Novosphingobium percolationis]|uniref:strawberry notch-like NTP hydrolase domain-containing protein n=1 Tax=Novosphingobium percolationis TaxID=2871811 RepID=UPI001CD51BAB
MSGSSLALAFDCSAEPPVLAAARAVAARLTAVQRVDRGVLNAIMRDAFGGSDAKGRWSVREAHAVVELGQVLWLQGNDRLSPNADPMVVSGLVEIASGLVPSQTVRSEEQIELQQFATPPRLAWLAARAAGIAAGECVLEPSAGTGMLAVWAAKADVRLVLNEISALRRECLGALFPQARITDHDGELIDDLLERSIVPSVVLMNPPYSHGLERGHDGQTAARHVRSAWKRLGHGGRLVAILPEWFDCHRFLPTLHGPATLRANLALDRAFVRQGTSITTRFVVIDKADRTGKPLIARTCDLERLAELVAGIGPRHSHGTATAPVLPARRLPLLPSGRSKSVVMPPPAAIKAMGAVACAFDALIEPAPLAEQVGHYLPYRPSRIRIEGAAEHPTPLVESVAMGSIAAPVPDQIPELPDGLVSKGVLSRAQLETLIYAASAHARDLPGKFIREDRGCTLVPDANGASYRMGYFLGDGTGAGKGRQVASVILDRWVRGERRHIWVSKNEALLEDARRDWAALGGLPIDIQPLGSWKLGTPVSMGEGILFVTYPTLRSGRNDATRLDQILGWAGADFSGVLIFDEAHAMANAAGGEGARWRSKGSEQGVTGVRLQNLLPRARVLYASATGASDVNNLAYATRLGLWGPETAFANREAFVADIRVGGIAAMELVARDLKALGLYAARALSFAGVEYEILEHALTPDQVAVYDAYADAWAIIHANLSEALEATRIVDSETGGTLNSGAKSAALSIFEGTKQRLGPPGQTVSFARDEGQADRRANPKSWRWSACPSRRAATPGTH